MPRSSLLYCMLAMALAFPAFAQDKNVDLPLTGAAYRIADQAYAAYAQGDYKKAVEQAREAVRLRPDVSRLHALLRNAEQALAASQRPTAKRPAQTSTLVRSASATNVQKTQTKQVQRNLSQELAQAAYQALSEGRADLAAANLKQAIADSPNVLTYRLLLIQSLWLQNQYEEAETVATGAIALDNESPIPAAMRAVSRTHLGSRALAYEDFSKAMVSHSLNYANSLNIRLIAADAALANDDTQRAKDLLTHATEDYSVAVKQRLLLATLVSDKMLSAPDFTNPHLDCHTASNGTSCALVPVDEQGYALAKAAYAAFSEQRYPAALQLTKYLTEQYPDNADYQRLYLRALAATGQWEQMTTRLHTSNTTLPDNELAYLALSARRFKEASAIFSTMDANGSLKVQTLQDAAYAALAANKRQTASAYFRRVVDAVATGTLTLTPQQTFDTRRTIAEIERHWGFNAAGNYRGNSMMTGPISSAVPGDALQAGAEIWWRPEQTVRNNRYVDVYARLIGTAYDKTGGVTGSDSVQGAIGARWKPLPRQNAIFSVERLIKIGQAAQSDWLLRAGYSWNKGTDLRVDAPSWWSSQLFAEAGRHLQQENNYFVSELQTGRSFRFRQHTLITPHAVIAADYNTGYSVAKAIGIGAGISLRQWFREDRYNAPRSYFDVSIQYRAHLSGDNRAKGFFIRSGFNY